MVGVGVKVIVGVIDTVDIPSASPLPVIALENGFLVGDTVGVLVILGV